MPRAFGFGDLVRRELRQPSSRLPADGAEFGGADAEGPENVTSGSRRCDMFVRPLPGLSQLRSLIVEEWKSPSGFVVKRTGRRTAPEPPRTPADPRVPSASPSLSRETGAPGGAPGGGSVRGSPAAAAASRHRQSVAAETDEVVVVQGGLRGRAVGPRGASGGGTGPGLAGRRATWCRLVRFLMCRLVRTVVGGA